MDIQDRYGSASIPASRTDLGGSRIKDRSQERLKRNPMAEEHIAFKNLEYYLYRLYDPSYW